MKKLVIYDHNGIQRFQSDVFVEGQDFKWVSPTPTAFWIGTILIIDEKEFNEMHGIRAIEPFPQPEPELEPALEVASVEEPVAEEEVELEGQAPFTTALTAMEITHIKEAPYEPTPVINKSFRDKRVSKASKPKSSKAKVEDGKGGTVSKRNK